MNEINLTELTVIILTLIFLAPLLIVLVPQAIKNHKENKRLKDFPRWIVFDTCNKCNHPLWPPLRHITDFPNPFCRLRLVEETITCLKCSHSITIATEVE